MNRAPIRVVFDTKVIVSGWISPRGPCRTLLTMARNSLLDLALSRQAVDEYFRVLSRPGLVALHGVDKDRIRTLLEDVAQHSTLIVPPEIDPIVVADPTDDVFLACAIGAGAQFIVSGDHHLLDLVTHRGIDILRPHEMLALLDSNEEL